MAERIPLILSSIDGEYRIVELPAGDTVPGSGGGGDGATGATGADGAGVGLIWNFSSATTSVGIADGEFRFNADDPNSITKIWISHKDATGRNVEALLDT